MRSRPLGKTGLVVSEMSLGTWGLSGDGYGAVDEALAEKVILRAIDIGINFIDTCDAYGAGKMEALLGRVLEGKSDVIVATRGGIDRKISPGRKKFTKEYLRDAVERSLKRLKKPAIELYLLHNPTPDALAVGDAAEAMIELKKEGKILHWGVSAGDFEVARNAIDKGAEVVSMTYNFFNSNDVNRVSGDLMVSRAGLIVHSTLGYGLFSGDWTKEREFADGDHRRERWTRLELEQRIDHLDSLRHLLHGEVTTMRGAAIRYALAQHLVSTVLLGPRTEKQLEELVRETGGGPRYLPDADLRDLPASLEKAGIVT